MKAVIKLGGSVISKKKEVNDKNNNLEFFLDKERITAFAWDYIKKDNLTQLAKEIAEAKMENSDLQLVLSNGAGPFGHTLHKNHDKGVSAETIHYGVEFFNTIVRGVLREQGIETDVATPYILCKPVLDEVKKDYFKLTYTSDLLVSTIIDSEKTSISYGDTILFRDLNDNYKIISADDIIVEVGEKWPADIVIAVSDNALYKNFGKPNQKLVSIIEVDDTPFEDKMKQMNITFPKSGDATGGMEKKISNLYAFTYRTGITSQIIDGNKAGYLKRALNGEELGTIIKKI
jgi:isopentenyl phosphate kinase